MLVFYLVLSLGVSFLCSLYEAVILTISHPHIARLVKSGHRSGPILKKLKKNIDSSLSAILTLNTIAHTIGAAGVGAEAHKMFGDKWVTLSSVILTLLILVFSEIIPKTIGATYWKSLAPFVAYGIQMFIFITYPFVILFNKLAQIINKNAKHHKRITREELLLVAEIGLSEGALTRKETTTIKNLLRLRKILAKDIMTPRSVMFALQKDTAVREVLEKHPHIPFSRIPLYDNNIDDIVGKVLRFDIFEAFSESQADERLETLKSSLHGVPFSQPVSEVLDNFIKQQEHMFLVYDEHGGVAGIITLEDTIETLLGVEIVDEFDSVEDMRKFAQEQWEKRRHRGEPLKKPKKSD